MIYLKLLGLYLIGVLVVLLTSEAIVGGMIGLSLVFLVSYIAGFINKRIVNRIVVFIRFSINTIKEAVLHPLSVSVLDKNTGRIIDRYDRRKK